MSELTGWDRRLSVVADGRGLIGHAGAVLLRRLADRTGLTAALAAVLPVGTGTVWRDRAAVVVQFAVAIVLGAVNLSDAEQLQAHHQGLFGPEVSDSTTRRTLEAMDEEVLTKIARAVDPHQDLRRRGSGDLSVGEAVEKTVNEHRVRLVEPPQSAGQARSNSSCHSQRRAVAN